MSNSFFYTQIDKSSKNRSILDQIERYSLEFNTQIFVINRPLVDKNGFYDFDDGFVVLSPGYKLIFMSPVKNEDFDIYVEDLIQDIAAISKKYEFMGKVGRPRVWQKSLVETCIYSEDLNFSSVFDNAKIFDFKEKRIGEIIISLLTGSINNNDKVDIEVNDTVLDRLKQKIILFDGEQTKFIYENLNKKVTLIQGMSGTGKTELLLHKLKEIYTDNKDNKAKIFMTCHNEILAATLRNRIPEFFNFMKVEQQIEWNERLWCIRAWGSRNNKNSGVYSYICKFYGVEFKAYGFGVDFGSVCKSALKFIKENNLIASKGYALDFVLVDESQDFSDNFFDLIELVTKDRVFVAGDIFQNIFDPYIIGEKTPDYLLNKCYRTDPRTLMFSHALALGLFEEKKLDWLDDDQWLAYGYKIEINSNKYKLSRDKLLKFEDLRSDIDSSIEIINSDRDDGSSFSKRIVEIILKILQENPTAGIGDIGIVFLADRQDAVVSAADTLSFEIKSVLGWTVNKAFESREKIENTLFVSSRNHVKGLEFPFFICVTNKIHSSVSYRNSLYMMLTRSFLKSYLVVSDKKNPGLIDRYSENLDFINKNECMEFLKPSDKEIEKMKSDRKIPKEKTMDLYDFSYHLFDEMGVDRDRRDDLYAIIKASNAVNKMAIVELVNWHIKNNIG